MKDTNRLDQLQFFRFVCFLLICLHHLRWYQFSWLPNANGAANAVSFFVILSGFGSAYSGVGSEIKCNIKTIIKYIGNKIRRFYPLYFTTTLIMVACSDIPRLVSAYSFDTLKPILINLIHCLCLVQAWIPHDYFAFNGAGWFMSTMLFLYLLNLPLKTVLNLIYQKKHGVLLLIVNFISLYIVILLYSYITRNTNTEFTQYILPISRVCEYASGMVLGYLFHKMNIYMKNIDNKIVFTILEIVVLMIWVKGMYVNIESWQFRIVHWFLPNCLLIGAFTFGKGLLSSLFKTKPLKYLGDVSFECYLLHGIIVQWYLRCSGITEITRLGKAFSITYCVLLTILFSSLISYKGRKIHAKNNADV